MDYDTFKYEDSVSCLFHFGILYRKFFSNTKLHFFLTLLGLYRFFFSFKEKQKMLKMIQYMKKYAYINSKFERCPFFQRQKCSINKLTNMTNHSIKRTLWHFQTSCHFRSVLEFCIENYVLVFLEHRTVVFLFLLQYPR